MSFLRPKWTYQKNCTEYANAKSKRSNAYALFVSAGTTIIDSGTTQHMFNTLDAFDNNIQPKNISVSCANETEIGATHVGNIKFPLGDKSILTLQDAKPQTQSTVSTSVNQGWE